MCIPDSAFLDYNAEFNDCAYIISMSEAGHLDSRPCGHSGPTSTDTGGGGGGGGGGPGKGLMCTTLNCEECRCCQLRCDHEIHDSTGAEVEDANSRSYFLCTELVGERVSRI